VVAQALPEARKSALSDLHLKPSADTDLRVPAWNFVASRHCYPEGRP
jgi:hypothetical protein